MTYLADTDPTLALRPLWAAACTCPQCGGTLTILAAIEDPP